MIQLSRNPIEGGSVVIRLSFKDLAGIDYVPIEGSVYYTLYAHHVEGDTWEIVNNKEDVHLESASIINLIFQESDLALLPACTTKRRVVINWAYLRNGEETVGRDSVDFHIAPLPVVGKA